MEYDFPSMRMTMFGSLVWVLILSSCASVDGRVFIQGGRAENLPLEGSTWRQGTGWIEGAGVGNDLSAGVTLGAGDFQIKAQLRMLKQRGSAASFFLGPNHFGFEGARDTVFLSGPIFGGVKLLKPAEEVVPRGEWIDFEVSRKSGGIQ